MCGLFGVLASNLTLRERTMFTDLGRISSLRGEDSTGMIVGSRKKKNGTKVKMNQMKEVMNPVSFFAEDAVRRALNVDNIFLLSGHARATTSGATNFTNAHPIQEGNIILCHNGTIDKWKPSKAEETVMSDSRIFARKISHLGPPAAFNEADSGAYAVTFVNTAQRTFNFARNGGRTLYVIFSSDGEALMWASEAEMLELILKREGVRHSWGDVALVPQGKLFTWKYFDRAKDGVSSVYKEVVKLSALPPGPSTPYVPTPEQAERVLDRKLEDWQDDPKYQEWLKKRAAWCGDPAIDEEAMNDEHDPTTVEMEAAAAEQSDPLMVCSDCEKEFRYCQCENPPWVARPSTSECSEQSSESTVPGSYCRKCREQATNCKCQSCSLIYPNPWELDAKGRWRPDPKDEAATQELGTPPVDGDVIARVAEHSRFPTVGEWINGSGLRSENSDDDTYIGFGKQPFAPSIAAQKLKDGCAICGHESRTVDTVFWWSEASHICHSCKGGDQANSFFGNVTMFESRYIRGDTANGTSH